MKKSVKILIGALALAFVFIIFVAALGSGPNTSADPNDHDGVYNYELYSIDNFDYKMGSYDTTSKPDEGNKYVVATIIMKNNDYYSKISTNPFYWDLRLGGVTYETSFDTYYHPSQKDSVDLAKGAEYYFSLVYEVPDYMSLDGAKLIWDSYPSDMFLDKNYIIPEMYLGNNPVKL